MKLCFSQFIGNPDVYYLAHIGGLSSHVSAVKKSQYIKAFLKFFLIIAW